MFYLKDKKCKTGFLKNLFIRDVFKTWVRKD